MRKSPARVDMRTNARSRETRQWLDLSSKGLTAADPFPEFLRSFRWVLRVRSRVAQKHHSGRRLLAACTVPTGPPLFRSAIPLHI